MVPLMIGFVGGYDELSGRKKAFLFSLVFVLGLAATLCVIGIITVAAGRLWQPPGKTWTFVVAGICFIMGLNMLGVFSFGRIPLNPVRVRKGSYIGAFFLGMLFGVVSLPCTGPVLVVILAYLASSGRNLGYGMFLLLMYGLGHSLLLVIAGTSAGWAKKMLESSRMGKAGNIFKKISGAVILLTGVYFLLCWVRN